MRHGETNENQQGIIQGHIEVKLSGLGREQVKKLALRLKNEKIDEIYSGDLKRAVDTTYEIAAFHPNVKVNVTPLLRERNHGKFEGKKCSEVSEAEFNKYFRTLEGKPNGGENWVEVGKRAKIFLQTILHQNTDKTVLIVAHGGIIIALLSLLTRTSPKDSTIFHTQKNTCVNIVEIAEDNSHKLHLLNCTKHLDC